MTDSVGHPCHFPLRATLSGLLWWICIEMMRRPSTPPGAPDGNEIFGSLSVNQRICSIYNVYNDDDEHSSVASWGCGAFLHNSLWPHLKILLLPPPPSLSHSLAIGSPNTDPFKLPMPVKVKFNVIPRPSRDHSSGTGGANPRQLVPVPQPGPWPPLHVCTCPIEEGAVRSHKIQQRRGPLVWSGEPASAPIVQ